MKVLHILNEIRPSGAEIMLKLAAPYWQSKGLQLHALSTGKYVGSFTEELEKCGYAIHHIPFSSSLSFYVKFVRLIKTYQYDVIHIHTERAAFTYALLSQLSGVKRIVRTIHSYFPFEGATRMTRAIRRLFIRSLGVKQISVSKSVQQNEHKRFRNPTSVIYNWCDSSHFKPPTEYQKKSIRNELGLNDKKKYIVSIGNCSPIKNHMLILRALAILNSRGERIYYLHVGEEDQGQPERRVASQLNIGDLIHFVGYQNDVRPYLWAADAFVMPSKYEGFGIAALEAMFCGLPVVISNSPGLIEFRDFYPRLVIIEPNPQELANAISKIVNGTELTNQISLEILYKHFSVKEGALRYYMAYLGEF